MDGELADFQDRLLAALLGPPGDTEASCALPPLALRVHRNTVLTAASEALAANFPAVVDELGPTAFRAAAADFVRRQPPIDPRLVTYGVNFPDFLDSAGANRAAALARLDRAWTEAHLASEAQPIVVGTIAAADPAWLASLRVQPHPAARWPTADAATATRWSEARGIALAEAAIATDRVLILSRPLGVVIATPGPAGLARLLETLRVEPGLLNAAAHVLSGEPAFDLGDGFARLLAAGVLVPASLIGVES